MKNRMARACATLWPLFRLAAMPVMVLLVAGSGMAQVPATPTGATSTKKADFLFVQNAKGVTYDNGKLTLKGVGPTTLFFSDRPERIVGHMSTTEFVRFWSEGKDSFLSDAPNATLSIFGGGKITDVVVVLRTPVLKGGDLSYDIRVLQGKMPAKGGLGSLFIDVVGMPLTPVSVAGVDRRVVRRSVY